MSDWNRFWRSRAVSAFVRQPWVAPAICILLITTTSELWRLVDANEASQTHVDEYAFALGVLLSLACGIALFGYRHLLRLHDTDLATLQQAQSELRKSERRFRTFFEKAPFGIQTIYPDGTVMQANPGLAALLGYSTNELQYISVLQLTHQDDRTDSERELQQVAAGNFAATSSDRRLVHKDGHAVWVHMGSSWVLDEDGNAEYSISIVRDASGRKRSEERLQLADEILKRIPVVVVAADGDGQITYVSPYVKSMLGYEPEQLLGEGWWRLIQDVSDAQDSAKIREYVSRCARRERLPFEGAYENTVTDANGNPHWVLWSDACGPGNVVIGVGHEVTDLKAAQEESCRLANIVESTDDAIVSMSLDGTILSWNPGATRLYGYAASEIVGRSEQLLVPPEREEEFSEVLKRIEHGESLDHFETLRLTKDGQPKPVTLTISPIWDHERRVIGCSKIARDLTETKKAQRLEEQVRQTQRMESIGRLAGGVAHDFNNLIMIISSYGQMLQEQLQADARATRSLEQIMKASERAAGLTQQLLAFSRKQVLAPKVIDMNTIVEETVRMLERMIGEDIELTFIPTRPLSHVKVDPGQLSQVLINLSVNARDAMPRGGKLIIETQDLIVDEDYINRHPEMPAGGYVMLKVTDTGVGMTGEVQDRIFEPFFTTKEQGKGTGLGLSTVYGMIKQSGGFIWASSEPGQGTCFTILFPRSEKLIPVAARHAGQQMPQGNETVLLVEDECALRGSLDNFLTSLGYQVLEASNGEEALEVAKRHAGPIDIMISDVVMPKVSGRDLATAIHSRRPATKVLFMSGYTDDTVLRHGVLDASLPFLQKPFALSTLAQKVRELLTERQTTIQAQ